MGNLRLRCPNETHAVDTHFGAGGPSIGRGWDVFDATTNGRYGVLRPCQFPPLSGNRRSSGSGKRSRE